MGAGGQGLDARRVVQVLAGPEAGARGSGYLVSGQAVLTAAHVVAGTGTVRLRFLAGLPGEWTAPGEVVFRHPGADVAVVALTGSPAADGPPAAVDFGAIEQADGELPCSLMGFPRFKVRKASLKPELGTFRDVHHELAVASPFANAREGTLALRVNPPAADPDPARTPWGGMSGAAVWSDGRLVGLVSAHHRTDGLGLLSATRADRWHALLDPRETALFAALTGFPARPDELTRVLLPRSADAERTARYGQALHALARAEHAASAAQPYRFPQAGAPGLERVYVTQRVTPGADTDRIPAADILTRHRHALIEGEPGSGKSTFTRHAARTAAAPWLSGEGEGEGTPEVCTIRVPAPDLAHAAPLPALLHRSVRQRLAAHLTTDPPADLFEPGTARISWQLLVDGLDEIVDPAARQRVVAVIAADAQRADSPYRWLVTTRTLPAGELEPLRTAGLGSYTLAPFDDRQLGQLIRQWPAAGGESADERAERFLRQVANSGLRRLVRIPLIAAITLVVFHRDPDTRLPAGRPGLYREFVTFLLGGREGEDGRRSALRATVAGAGGSERLADWLDAHRIALLTALGRRTVSGDSPLLDEALAWIEERAPQTTDFLHGWREVVTGLLTGSGLLLHEAGPDQLHWIHRSFAEYLAARDIAAGLPEGWPGELPDRDGLLQEGLSGDRQDLALLSIACWAARAGSADGVEGLFDHLLDRSDGYGVHGKYRDASITIGEDTTRPDYHAALAGRLLAEGVRVAGSTQDRVLLRLVARAGSAFHSRQFSPIIAAQPRPETALGALRAMTADTASTLNVRCGAVAAIGLIFGMDELRAAVREMPPVTGSAQIQLGGDDIGGSVTVGPVSDGRLVLAHHLTVLGTQAHDDIRELLHAVTLPPGDDLGRVVGGEAALALGDRELLLRFLGPGADLDRDVGREITLLLKGGATEVAAARLAEITARLDTIGRDGRDSWGLVGAAESAAWAYLGAGGYEEAAMLARRILALPARERAGGSESEAYAVLAYAGDTDTAFAALHRTEGSWDDGPDATRPLSGWGWKTVATALHNSGHGTAVRQAAHARLELPFPRWSEVVPIAEFLLDTGDPAGTELLLTLAGHPDADPETRRRAVGRLLDTTHHEAAVAALTDVSRGPLSDCDGLDVARLLADVGAVDDAVRLARDLLADGRPEEPGTRDRSHALGLLHGLRPDLAVPYALALAGAPDTTPSELLGVARLLRTSDAPEQALAMLRRLAGEPSTRQVRHQAAAMLLADGHGQDAVRAYRATLAELAVTAGRFDQSDALEAARGLLAAGAGLTAPDLLALRTVANAVLTDRPRPPQDSLDWRQEETLVTLAGLLADAGAEQAAADLLRRTVETRAPQGGAAAPTVEALERLTAATGGWAGSEPGGRPEGQSGDQLGSQPGARSGGQSAGEPRGGSAGSPDEQPGGREGQSASWPGG